MLKKEKIKFIQLWFTDIIGNLKSVTIPATELKSALQEGKNFDGSSIEGFTRIQESDMIAKPDQKTFKILPWSMSNNREARMFCDILLPDLTPYDGDPRLVLKRNLQVAKEMGFSYYVGPELEYFYFKTPNSVEPLDYSGYFDLTPPDVGDELRMQTIAVLEEMGVNVEASHHEVAPSQQEIDLVFQEALEMADRAMTYKLAVKETALRNNVYATFMPKPKWGINGSGMHVHLSLFKNGKNVMGSMVGKQFMSGILRHAKEITLVTNQWVNSYKRLVPGYEAPVYISWAKQNRSTLLRIPAHPAGKEVAERIEYRAPDPACNPYLCFAVLLAAGLEGIKKNYKVPPAVEKDLYGLTREAREEDGIECLPGSLGEAIAYARESELLRKALGENVLNTLIKNKTTVWEEYRAQVTEYEIKKDLPTL